MAEEKKEDAAEAQQAKAAQVEGEAAPAAAGAAAKTEPAANAVAAEPQSAAGTAAKDGSASSNPAADSTAPAADAPAEPDWKDRYARLLADFDNFKKRTARDREDTYRFAECDILKDVLPTVDNLALALANAKDKNDEFVKGVQLVYDTFLKALKEHGAEPFDAIGKPLDTATMEAIATLPSETIAEGFVSNEAKRGWMLKDKVLRAAQVVVSSGNPAAATESPADAADAAKTEEAAKIEEK